MLLRLRRNACQVHPEGLHMRHRWSAGEGVSVAFGPRQVMGSKLLREAVS